MALRHIKDVKQWSFLLHYKNVCKWFPGGLAPFLRLFEAKFQLLPGGKPVCLTGWHYNTSKMSSNGRSLYYEAV
eukprot:scaffold13220_cov91-Cylindrotheca_fusiformis.AAC.6